MIISMIYIILYLFSCWISMSGYFQLSSLGNSQRLSEGLMLLLIGGVGRFIVLYIAWSNDFPLSYAVIAQFFPLVCLLLTWINFAISEHKKDVTS